MEQSPLRPIGVIGAMRIEMDALCGRLADPRTETVGGISFTSGSMDGVPLVCAVCGIGKVFAAMCTQAMILRYAPRCIINTGVAGGLSDTLRIGQFAVATAVVQHDMDTSPIGDPVGLISGINRIEIDSDEAMTRDLCGIIAGQGITYERGVIASGDQFVADSGKKSMIRRQFGAIACDMESAAIGQVCYVNRVPFAVLRAISDGGDEAAVIDYPTFAARAAQHGVAVTASYAAQCAAEKQQIYQ